MHMTQVPGFLDPTVGSRTASIPLASRPVDLTGTVVGLLDNTKEQGAIILQTVAEALHQHYGIAGVHLRRKEHYSKPATPALIDAMASTVHVAVVAVGG
jgi:hypothetical protein